jgi:hypothetical protein
VLTNNIRYSNYQKFRATGIVLALDETAQGENQHRREPAAQ